MKTKDGDQGIEDREHRGRSVKTLMLVYLPPWLAWLLSWPVAAGAWALWGRRVGIVSELFAMIMLVATGLLAVMVDHLAKGRGRAIRNLARWSAVGGGGWLIFAGLYGPWHRGVVDVWAGGGFLACVFWMSRRALLTGKGEVGVVSDATGKLLEVLDGARLSNVHAARTKLGPVVRARAEVDRGRQSVGDLVKAGNHIEAIAHLRPDAVQMTRDPKDAGQVDVTIIPHDTLDQEIPWAPDRPGESIALPIRIGPYADGEDCAVHFPGDERTGRNLTHFLCQALTGGGKTELARGLFTKVLCRTEVTVIASDPVKGVQTLGVFVQANALELYSLDMIGSRAMLAAVKRSIAPRAAFLGARGLKQWQSGCGLNLLVAWWEEANWATQGAALEAVAEQARSVGILLFVSQQRAAYTKTSTDLRANLAGGICGGMADAMDAKFCLTDELVDAAGDMLERWSNTKPGYFVVQHPSIEASRQVIPVRAERSNNDAPLLAELRKWAHVRSPMDATTRESFGATYDQLKAVMAGADPVKTFKGKAAGKDLSPAGEGELLDSEDDYAIEVEDDTEDEDLQSDDDGMPPLGEQVEPDMRAEIDQPIGPLDEVLAGMPMGGPGPARKLETDEARSVVEEHLRAILAAGKTSVAASDILRMKPPTTRTRSWVRTELMRRCGEVGPGETALIRTVSEDQNAGVYEIVAPAKVAAESGHAP